MYHQPKLGSGSIRLLKALAISAALVSSPAIWAQGSGQLEEVIVTAEFRATNVQDTPLAITAINSDMMDARSQTSLNQIAAQAPNVTLTPAGAARGPSMIAYIRGIGQNDFNYALEPGVGIYIDDVYYPTLTGSLVDLLDLDRVEVLRGPQGTLAGKNSIGGAIKLYSKQAVGDNTGSMSVTYGSYNRIDMRGSADFTVLPDQLFARISGVSKKRDGYVTIYDFGCKHKYTNVPTFNVSKLSDCKTGEEGDEGYTAGRVSLRWLASDDVTVNFAADVTNQDTGAMPEVLIAVNEGLTGPGGATGPYVGDNTIPNFLGISNPGYPNAFYPSLGYNGTYIIGKNGRPVYLTNMFVPKDGYTTYASFMDPNINTDPNNLQQYSPNSIRPETTLFHWGVQGTIDWDINDQYQLKLIGSYREYDSSFAQDEDQTPINSQYLLQHLTHDQYSLEGRLNGSVMDGKLDFTVGGFWFEQDGTLEANVNLYYVQFNFVHGPDPTPSYNHAGFLHATYHISDDMNLSAGLRYSDDEKTYTHFRRNPDGTKPSAPCGLVPYVPGQGLPEIIPGLTVPIPNWVGHAPNCALFGLFNQGATFSDSRLDWRVALDYRWNDELMTYVQVSTGYKGGGVNPRPFILAQLLPFNSETLTTYEIGFKSNILDDRMRLNGAFFYNDYSDIIQTLNPCYQVTPDPTDGPGPCLLPINAGAADVYGVELEMEWHPLENAMIDASMSYLDFEYTTAQSPVTKTMVPPYSPEWKWSVGGQYTWDYGDLGTVTARIDASFQDDVYSDPVNSIYNKIPSYILTNARVTWASADSDWDAAFEVTNLTNEYYYTSLFDQYLSGGGTLSGAPGMPRAFGITLRRHF